MVISIFSFPTIFSTLSETEIIILATFTLSSANPLIFVHRKNLSFGKKGRKHSKTEKTLVSIFFPFPKMISKLFSSGLLTLSRTANFGLFQTEYTKLRGQSYPDYQCYLVHFLSPINTHLYKSLFLSGMT